MYWSYAVGAAAGAAPHPHWALAVLPLGMTAFLVHRALRDHARCQAVYHAAWNRYNPQKIMYHLVLKVF
ncbi:hypothetical protein LSTR_LSTR013920 [Laodelphax striatellus]|uniref:Steroid 5-alpha reductase C-terminal domain-containing protein n=1 Tax=Laodelphax striatellus TaxID=195883 RepID=A0A482X4L7_LAOST|nr:hypothetical protein LSTR_LSTR013920 [Laodelphax striatellus]